MVSENKLCEQEVAEQCKNKVVFLDYLSFEQIGAVFKESTYVLFA